MKKRPRATHPRRVAVRVLARYAGREVYARPCLVGEVPDLAGGWIEIGLLSFRDRKVYGTRIVDGIGEKRPGEVGFSLEGVPWGCCAFQARVYDRAGIPLLTDTIHDTSSMDFAWLGSVAGVSRQVPAPWSPLQVSTVRGRTAVECWGRICAFDRGSLIAGMQSQGIDLLAIPLGFRARVDGREVRWGEGKRRLVASAPDQVVFEHCLPSSCGLAIWSRVQVDFDGVVRFDCALTTRKKLTLERLGLELALPAAQVKYLYTFPGRWGSGRNARALPRGKLAMGFQPYVWLGDEEVGLAWFAESDRNWFCRSWAGGSCGWRPSRTARPN